MPQAAGHSLKRKPVCGKNQKQQSQVHMAAPVIPRSLSWEHRLSGIPVDCDSQWKELRTYCLYKAPRAF